MVGLSETNVKLFTQIGYWQFWNGLSTEAVPISYFFTKCLFSQLILGNTLFHAVLRTES